MLFRRQNNGVRAMLLAILAVLAASIPGTIQATPLTTQVTVELKAQNTNDDTRDLQAFSIVDLLQLTNGTCPADCPLCQCTNVTTEAEEMECTLSKSIEACASNSFQKCYADLIPGDFDVEGLCAVECANKPEGERPSANCRICEIFACCKDCPANRAAECFPPNVEDGYTPVGWKPADCSSSSGERVGLLHVRGLLMVVAVPFVVLSLFT